MMGYCPVCEDVNRISKMIPLGTLESKRFKGSQYDLVKLTTTFECVNCFHREFSCTTQRETHDASTDIVDVDDPDSTGAPARFGT